MTVQDYQQLHSTFEFIKEIEALKNVLRKTKPAGFDRFENSAEHSWHVCISALMLKDFADDTINIDRVIKMLLIHDLGEIDCGDIIIYDSETPENKAAEKEGVERLLKFLTPLQQKTYIALWQEFEAGETADSKYARAIDRIPPLLHNMYGDYSSWKVHNIKREQVLGVNGRINLASRSIWSYLEKEINLAFDRVEAETEKN